jgi:hypothetical protein
MERTLYGFNDVHENIAFWMLKKFESMYGSFTGFLEIKDQCTLFGKVVTGGKFIINGESLTPQNRVITISKHAMQRMFDRQVNLATVTKIATEGTHIHTTLDKKKDETYRHLGFVGDRPVHVLFTLDKITMIKNVVTVIIPDADEWENGFTTLKRSMWNSVRF